MTTPMRLSLAITADATGVAPATAEVRREIDGLEADARAAATALSAHAAANDEVAAASRRAMEAVRSQGAAERELQAAIDRSLNFRSFTSVGTAFANDAGRGRDIAAYGEQLDQLRAKYSPLFAVIQSYKVTQAEIRQAHAVGAIGIDEMAAALGRERQAALASIAALKGRGTALLSAGAGGGAGQFATGNIAAQFQDIAVTSAMGMSPLQIALQQGTQLSAVINTMERPVAGLAAAFMSVINPVSLVTIGVVGLGAALIQYLSGLKADIPSVDDILGRHEDHISRLGPAYEMAAKKSREYATQSADAIDALLTGDLEQATAKIRALTTKAGGEINKAITQEGFQLGPAAGLVQSRFEPFRDVIDLLGRGKISAVEFAEGVRQIELADPKLAGPAAELRSFTKEAVDATVELSGVTGVVDRVALAFAELQDGIDKINPFNAAGRLGEVEQKASELFTKARAGQIDVHDLAEELRSLAAVNPDLSGVIGEIAALADEAVRAKMLVEGLANTTPKTRRLGAMDEAGERFDETLEFQRRINPDLFDKLDPDKPKKTRGGSKADPYRDIMKSADDRIVQIRQEIELLGHAGAEVEALRYEQEMLSRATDKGRSLDEEQIAAIKAKAEEYGKLRAELAATKLEQDLLFEREQLFRSPTEQRVASALRSAGIDPASERGEYLAEQIRVNEQLELGRDLAMDFGASLADAFADGKLEAEELLGIVMDLIQQLMSNPGALSGLGSFISSLFGGGFASTPASAPIPTPRPFRNGGVFTNSIIDRPTPKGSKFGEMGEAGIEAVMPLKRDSQGRLGVISEAANQNGGGTSTVRLIMPEGWRTEIVSEARQGARDDTVQIVQENDRARNDYYNAGGNPR